MTLTGHSLDDIAGRALADQARERAGLSAATNWEAYSLWLDPYDTPSDRYGYSFGYPATATRAAIPPQSCCTKALLAFARDFGRDGRIVWRGRPLDVLHTPQAAGLVGLSPALAMELGRQAGILREPGADRPETPPGTAILIGGDDGLPPAARVYGGLAHGLLVLDELPDGTLRTIEGGKGPGGTAVAICERELVKIGPHWWVRDVGATGGRRVRWSYQMAALPAAVR